VESIVHKNTQAMLKRFTATNLKPTAPRREHEVLVGQKAQTQNPMSSE